MSRIKSDSPTEKNCQPISDSEPKKEKTGAGRPTKYSEKLADEICQLLENGISLFKISQIEGMPTHGTIRAWIRENEEFSHKYALAKEVQAEHYAEKIIDEAFNAQDAQLGRLRMDALRWTASKLLPKKYGDRIEHDIKQRTEVSYSFSIPDRETIQLESGALPTLSLPIKNDSTDSTESEAGE